MSSYSSDWFYNISNVGDVVTVVNTGRDSEPGNGITDWMVSWPAWLAKSETKRVKSTVSLLPPTETDDADEEAS